MKNISIFFIFSLFFLSCSSDGDSEDVNISIFSEARSYMEAATILSNYNLTPDAQINIEVTSPMNLKTAHNSVHAAVQSVFNTSSGPTVLGSINVNPFGMLDVGSAQMDVYSLNDAYNSASPLTSNQYSVQYSSSNASYSSFTENVLMDFDLLVDNNLTYQDGKYFLDKSDGLSLEWQPLQNGSSDVFVGFCPDGEKCFYEKIEDTGTYTFDDDIFASLNSGHRGYLALARGYQHCFPNLNNKEICITNFSIANGGLIVIR